MYATTIASETTMAFPAQAREVFTGARHRSLLRLFTFSPFQLVPTLIYHFPVKGLGRGLLNSCGRRRQESLGEERDRSRSRTLGLIRSGAGRGFPRPLPLLYLPGANYLLVTRVSNQKMRSLFLLQHCLWVRGILCQSGFRNTLCASTTVSFYK